MRFQKGDRVWVVPVEEDTYYRTPEMTSVSAVVDADDYGILHAVLVQFSHEPHPKAMLRQSLRLYSGLDVILDLL